MGVCFGYAGGAWGSNLLLPVAHYTPQLVLTYFIKKAVYGQ